MEMKWKSGGLKTPLSRAKGFGSAHHGVHHWMMQRITAVANVFLGLWFVSAVLHLAGAEYETVRDWLSEPLNAVLMILFVISSFYHAVLGAQVIVEDYIHGELFKVVKLITMKLFYFGVAVLCIFSILKVAL